MIRPITDTLRHIGGGIFIDMASDKMNELVTAVDSSGKSGKLTLEVSVKKATRGGAMHITGKIRLTKPAEDAMEAMLFAPTLKDALTSRESEILQRLAAGQSHSAISQALFIHEKTVSSHKTNLMAKLSIDNFSDLLRYATENEQAL